MFDAEHKLVKALKENSSEEFIDVFNVSAAIKAENYEICEYESLTSMAREMKHTKLTQLLSKTLKEEKATLMDGFNKKVKPAEMMNQAQRDTLSEEYSPRMRVDVLARSLIKHWPFYAINSGAQITSHNALLRLMAMLPSKDPRFLGHNPRMRWWKR